MKMLLLWYTKGFDYYHMEDGQCYAAAERNKEGGHSCFQSPHGATTYNCTEYAETGWKQCDDDVMMGCLLMV